MKRQRPVAAGRAYSQDIVFYALSVVAGLMIGAAQLGQASPPEDRDLEKLLNKMMHKMDRVSVQLGQPHSRHGTDGAATVHPF